MMWVIVIMINKPAHKKLKFASEIHTKAHHTTCEICSWMASANLSQCKSSIYALRVLNTMYGLQPARVPGGLRSSTGGGGGGGDEPPPPPPTRGRVQTAQRRPNPPQQQASHPTPPRGSTPGAP